MVAVIGDGAITGGMAYEAMNHAGSLGSRLIVILNDNGMSIAPAVGALNDHLAELRAGKAGQPVPGPGLPPRRPGRRA